MTEAGRRRRRTIQRLGGRTINRLAVAVLRLGLPAPPYSPRSALVMETVGRKTGKRRLIPMGYLLDSADRLMVVAEHGERADWVRNALAAGSVRVWLGRHVYRGRVSLVHDVEPEEVLRRIGNRTHSAVVRRLGYEPRAVRIDLSAGA